MSILFGLLNEISTTFKSFSSNENDESIVCKYVGIEEQYVMLLSRFHHLFPSEAQISIKEEIPLLFQASLPKHIIQGLPLLHYKTNNKNEFVIYDPIKNTWIALSKNDMVTYKASPFRFLGWREFPEMTRKKDGPISIEEACLKSYLVQSNLTHFGFSSYKITPIYLLLSWLCADKDDLFKTLSSTFHHTLLVDMYDHINDFRKFITEELKQSISSLRLDYDRVYPLDLLNRICTNSASIQGKNEFIDHDTFIKFIITFNHLDLHSVTLPFPNISVERPPKYHAKKLECQINALYQKISLQKSQILPQENLIGSSIISIQKPTQIFNNDEVYQSVDTLSSQEIINLVANMKKKLDEEIHKTNTLMTSVESSIQNLEYHLALNQSNELKLIQDRMTKQFFFSLQAEKRERINSFELEILTDPSLSEDDSKHIINIIRSYNTMRDNLYLFVLSTERVTLNLALMPLGQFEYKPPQSFLGYVTFHNFIGRRFRFMSNKTIFEEEVKLSIITRTAGFNLLDKQIPQAFDKYKQYLKELWPEDIVRNSINRNDFDFLKYLKSAIDARFRMDLLINLKSWFDLLYLNKKKIGILGLYDIPPQNDQLEEDEKEIQAHVTSFSQPFVPGLDLSPDYDFLFQKAKIDGFVRRVLSVIGLSSQGQVPTGSSSGSNQDSRNVDYIEELERYVASDKLYIDNIKEFFKSRLFNKFPKNAPYQNPENLTLASIQDYAVEIPSFREAVALIENLKLGNPIDVDIFKVDWSFYIPFLRDDTDSPDLGAVIEKFKITIFTKLGFVLQIKDRYPTSDDIYFFFLKYFPEPKPTPSSQIFVSEFDQYVKQSLDPNFDLFDDQLKQRIFASLSLSRTVNSIKNFSDMNEEDIALIDILATNLLCLYDIYMSNQEIQKSLIEKGILKEPPFHGRRNFFVDMFNLITGEERYAPNTADSEEAMAQINEDHFLNVKGNTIPSWPYFHFPIQKGKFLEHAQSNTTFLIQSNDVKVAHLPYFQHYREYEKPWHQVKEEIQQLPLDVRTHNDTLKHIMDKERDLRDGVTQPSSSASSNIGSISNVIDEIIQDKRNEIVSVAVIESIENALKNDPTNTFFNNKHAEFLYKLFVDTRPFELLSNEYKNMLREVLEDLDFRRTEPSKELLDDYFIKSHGQFVSSDYRRSIDPETVYLDFFERIQIFKENIVNTFDISSMDSTDRSLILSRAIDTLFIITKSPENYESDYYKKNFDAVIYKLMETVHATSDDIRDRYRASFVSEFQKIINKSIEFIKPVLIFIYSSTYDYLSRLADNLNAKRIEDKNDILFEYTRFLWKLHQTIYSCGSTADLGTRESNNITSSSEIGGFAPLSSIFVSQLTNVHVSLRKEFEDIFTLTSDNLKLTTRSEDSWFFHNLHEFYSFYCYAVPNYGIALLAEIWNIQTMTHLMNKPTLNFARLHHYHLQQFFTQKISSVISKIDIERNLIRSSNMGFQMEFFTYNAIYAICERYQLFGKRLTSTMSNTILNDVSPIHYFFNKIKVTLDPSQNAVRDVLSQCRNIIITLYDSNEEVYDLLFRTLFDFVIDSFCTMIADREFLTTPQDTVSDYFEDLKNLLLLNPKYETSKLFGFESSPGLEKIDLSFPNTSYLLDINNNSMRGTLFYDFALELVYYFKFENQKLILLESNESNLFDSPEILYDYEENDDFESSSDEDD